MDTPQRIEIILAEDEHPQGALYIANDGQPFTKSFVVYAGDDRYPVSEGIEAIGMAEMSELLRRVEE